MKPIVLGPNQPKRFYRGGEAIAAFRGVVASGHHVPEDWVGSTTCLFGEGVAGLSRLPDGKLLRDEIVADPASYLGLTHVRRFGPTPELLVKLLDAGQRLPVHAHPDRLFSRHNLGLEHGKTEAWLVLGTASSAASVYVGFAEEISDATLRALVANHDSATLIGALNSLKVSPGDVIFVPAGVPHAIGEGVFILELQEPSDLSVMLDWEAIDLDGDRDGHLGIGFDRALACVHRSAWTNERLQRIWRKGAMSKGASSLLPAEADVFFRAELVAGDEGPELAPQFAILVVHEGRGELHSATADPMPIHKGQTILVPYAAGRTKVTADVRLIRCLPPDPNAPPEPSSEYV